MNIQEADKNATPGPWIGQRETPNVAAQVWTEDGRNLADVFGESYTARTANAFLMARARALPTIARELEELAMAGNSVTDNAKYWTVEQMEAFGQEIALKASAALKLVEVSK